MERNKRRYCVGHTYPAFFNGQIHHFTVILLEDSLFCYGIRWEDGDEEMLAVEDLDRLVDNYYLHE